MTTVATATNVNGSTQLSDKAKTKSDFDQFLFLLTQQLKNQDPLEPMDTAQFTSQLVQYSNVEQSIKVNDNLKSLISLQQSNTMVGLLGYIGKDIEAAGEKLPLVNSQVKFKYALPERADALTIKIKDKDGKVVRDIVGENTAGAHDMVWDGKDNNGVQLADGAYTLEVKAVKNENGVPKDMTIYTAMVGRVNAINTDATNPSVLIGTVSIPIANILTVRQPSI